MTELINHSAAQLADKLAAKDVSAVEVTQAHLYPLRRWMPISMPSCT